MTNSIADLGEADVVFVIGSNTTEAHPIIGIELKKAARRGTRIIVADPRRIRLVDHAVSWMALTPGTNVPLVNAMAKVIIDEGLADEAFIAGRTEGFDEFAASVADCDLDSAAEITGISADDIRDAALAYATADRAAIVYSMGVTQHTSGTEQVRAMANLAMLTGNVGKPGAGVNPLRGQNNVQGACDLACLPNCLPGYQKVTDQGALDRFCDYWETEHSLADEPGLTVVEMMDAACDGRLRAMYVMGENPVLSDPDQKHVIEALEALDFLVVQDIFLTGTAEMADVVLPAACFVEKEGTFTNTERRVQLVRKVVDAPGEALVDSEIIVRISNAMGYAADYDGPEDIMDEMAAVTPQYGGITYERLEATGGLQWPCPDESHPGTPILHADAFARGKGEFAVVDYTPAPEEADEGLPFLMTTGRHLWNFHTNTMTDHSPGLCELNPDGYVEMHGADAERLSLADGDWVEVASRRGTVTCRVRVTDGCGPMRGVLFMPFHFADAPANRLTDTKLDPTSKIPGLKVSAVSVRKVEGPA